MKKLIVAVAVLLSLGSYAQPCDTVVIDGNVQRGNIVNPMHAGDLMYWLCQGDTFITNGGGGHSLFFDYGSYGSIDGGGNHHIYVRSGSYVELIGGVAGTDVMAEYGATVIGDFSSTNTITYVYCLYFDSSTSPYQPCTYVNGATSAKDLPTISISNSQVVLRNQTKYTIYNQWGQVVQNGQGMTIDLPTQPNLYYIVTPNFKPFKTVVR
jgi:hypothetical protein